jgi:hypothetical protein
MSGIDIAKQVAEGLRQAGAEVGTGSANIATLMRPAPQPENPWDPPAGEPTPIELAVIVGSFDKRLIDGENIRASDLRVLVESVGTVPETSDRIVISSTEYAILAVNKTSPGGVDILYELQCRK